ncbi:hypothetical protein DEU32_102273 [Curtobacterium sp. AG1037]|uniref:hypothetical protein n=1 Tax=Curtobacterium sp. AG1037 TaxID=2183990 RepID=UPI000E0AE146|nr:hypothetical protein [Curtobacterium sp. AG1037]RDI01245.1 hypothetical protein DEU32_102273 [Curtobacterium sp. AG1037]
MLDGLCTWLLGWALARHALPRGVHVVAHAVLAGALAALCIIVPPASWGPLWGPIPGFPAVVGVAASTAAAVAARRTGHPVDLEPAGHPDVSVRAAADQ